VPVKPRRLISCRRFMTMALPYGRWRKGGEQ
jgi:hypothetical protein